MLILILICGGGGILRQLAAMSGLNPLSWGGLGLALQESSILIILIQMIFALLIHAFLITHSEMNVVVLIERISFLCVICARLVSN